VKSFFEKVGCTADEFVDQAKKAIHRRRPYTVDKDDIKTCNGHKRGDKDDSYPSGHTTRGYVFAIILAEMMPDKRKVILARAKQFGQSRVVCGAHFPSDVAAGQAAGTLIAATLMADPEFQTEFKAAGKAVQDFLGVQR
jgi:acid phosphatase (class A)